MRRLAVFIPVLVSLLIITACGGSSKKRVPTTLSVNPSTVSLALGQFSTLTVSVLDQDGAALTVSTKTTFATSNSAVAQVSTGGLVCAGTWDASFINCTPGQVGTATITVTNGGLTGTMTVFAHARVDRVTISPASVNCVSMGGTQQMTVQAFSNGQDVTLTVGPITWSTTNNQVATIDANGVATAAAPGVGSVFASVAGVNSVPATFVGCGVQSIHVHVANAVDTSFSVAPAATQQLAADVVDTAGKAISPTLSWYSAQPAVATVNSSGLVTAVAAGTASIGATCTNNCNLGLSKIFGDVTVANVSGTSASTAYAASTGGTSLVPIDTGSNAAGTAITLPSAPNSFLFAAGGARAFLGSAGGVITLDPSANTVTQTTSAPGKVLAAAPDASRVLVADTSVVYSVGILNNAATETLSIAGATAASFAPDASRAYILAGSTLFDYVPGSSTTAIALAAPANDVAFLPSEAFAYMAGGAASSITARAICNSTVADTKATAATPTFLRPTPDALKILAVDSPGLDILTRSAATQPGCPPPLTETLTTVNFNQGAFTPRQFILLSNGSKTFVISDLASLLVYDVTAGTTTTIPLAGGATAFTGGATLDGAKLYVGGSDNNVHRIDVAGGTDAQQISVSFTPNLVAVRPK